jgi:arylsulfatase A-like enzyme/Tfp pilus assembly protein PilF
MKNATNTISCLALLLGLTACADPGAESATRPNLLLVTLDTTRTDRLGCYGYEAANTPALDSLAARGVVFDKAYTPAPMTLTAHASLMTGLLPPQHGARVNGMHKLAADVPTLAERLSQEGYRTGAFVAAFVLDKKFGLGRGFDRYDDDLEGAYEQNVPEGLSTYRPGDRVVDAALNWLAEADDEEQAQPFFTWVHLYDAHFPWHPHGEGVQDANAESGTYDGEVSFMDEQVERLTAFLRERGLEENTIIVAVADHGEGLGDHHETEHAYLLNEEVLHVPWIMAGPGVKAGHRVPALVSLEDFQPTVIELLDFAGTEVQGRSLAAALRGEDIPSGVSYAETDLPWTSYRWAPQRSITTERWKYIRTPQAELYDRTSDCDEYANLAEARADVLIELEERLRKLESQMGKRESGVVEVSAEELQQLTALGYTAGSTADLSKAEAAELVDVKQRLAIKDLAVELRSGLARKTIGAREHVEIARHLVSESPETPAFHAELGAAYHRLGDFESALPVLEHTLELVPTDAGAHYALGDALQQMGRLEESRPHFAMALEFDPAMASAHVGLGNIRRTEGRADLAAGQYSEALRLQPGYPEAYYNLAMTFIDRGLPEKAVDHFERALEHKPGWGVAHARLARLFMSLRLADEALPHFEAALLEFPGAPDLHNDLGVALQQLGRPGEAHEHYSEVVQLMPESSRAWMNFGNLAFAHGNDKLALERYEEALRLAPERAEPNARLASLLATTADDALRDGPRAVELAERATEMSGGQIPRVFDALASAYAAAGRTPEAIAAAQRAQAGALATGDPALAVEMEQRLALLMSEEREVAPGPISESVEGVN